MFGGKGGVGKTSCAAAAALAIAARDPERAVLLLSADPAHSLADVLEIEVTDRERPVRGRPGLRVRELDADRAFQERRRLYHEAASELFESLRGGSNVDPSFDRRVVESLLDLAPPGLDELFAILAVTEAVFTRESRERGALVVLDTAPTGHALRLLALPAKAHEWVKKLMALLLEYRTVVGLGRLARELLALSRDLGRLQELLSDPGKARFVVVTRPAALPRLETVRLLRELARDRITVSAVLANAMTPPGCRRCRKAAAREGRELRRLEAQCRRLRGRRCRMVVAPLVAPPPRSLRALSTWSDTWQTVTR
jgi:arsenite-transporting ATPase